MKKLKKFLSSFILTGWLYKKLAHIKLEKIAAKKRKNIKLSGVETIHLLQKFFEKQNVMFFFDMGTLLGIIREGRLLRHDLDIDTAVFTTDSEKIAAIKKGLLEIGCEHKFRYTVEDVGVCEDSYILNNIKFDINYYSEAEGKSICYLAYLEPEKEYQAGELSTVALSCDKINGIKTVDFDGVQINIPEQPEKYLAQRYGENWRVPDKGYRYWCGPSTSKIPNKTIKSEF